MFILYMAESGVEELHSPPAHFVWLGVMIPADSWKDIVTEFEAVKELCDLRDVEIHTAWMHRRYSEQDSIPGFAQSSRFERRTQVENEFRRRAGNIGVRGTKKKIEAYRREVRSIRPYIHLTHQERRGAWKRWQAGWLSSRLCASLQTQSASWTSRQVSRERHIKWRLNKS